MHISDIEDLEKFDEENFGRNYYSVGALQDNGYIERWNYCDDRYDQKRLMLGNFFWTSEEAIDFMNYCLEYKHYLRGVNKMTMYEKLMEVSENKSLTNLIFKHMNLDKTFPAPNGARRSGKTTYKNVLVLTKFLSEDSIRGIVFDIMNRESERFRHRPDYFVVYYYNKDWAMKNCMMIREVLEDMFDEANRDYFRFERDRIIKI